MDETLADMLHGLADGRESAFAAVYDRFGQKMFRVARAILGSSAEAEDVVQDVFVALVSARASLPTVQNFPAYLFACVQRTAVRAAAKKHAHRERVAASVVETAESGGGGRADGAGRDGGTVDADTASALQRAVAELPIDQRTIIGLKIDAGLTFEEIGSALGISPNTAASRYRYALDKLRAHMETKGYGPSRLAR